MEPSLILSVEIVEKNRLILLLAYSLVKKRLLEPSLKLSVVFLFKISSTLDGVIYKLDDPSLRSFVVKVAKFEMIALDRKL